MITSAGKGMMGKSAIFESGIEKGSLFDGFDLTNKQTPETSYIILREDCPVFRLEKGVFSLLPQTVGKGEFKSTQLLELLENIHSPQLENLKKIRPQPFGTLSFALKISRLLRPYVMWLQSGYFRFSTQIGIQ